MQDIDDSSYEQSIRSQIDLPYSQLNIRKYQEIFKSGPEQVEMHEIVESHLMKQKERTILYKSVEDSNNRLENRLAEAMSVSKVLKPLPPMRKLSVPLPNEPVTKIDINDITLSSSVNRQVT